MTNVVTKYRFSAQDLLHVGNVPYRPLTKSANGYLMVRHDLPGGLTEEMSHEQLAEYARRGHLQFEQGFFAPPGVANRARAPEQMVCGLPARDKEEIRRRECYVIAFKRMEAEGTVRRTEGSIENAKHAIFGLASSIYLEGENPGRRRAGKEVTGIRMPCARTLKTWVRNYEREGLAGLRDKWEKCGKKGPDFNSVEQGLLHEVVRGYATPQRPNMKMIHQALQARFMQENEERRANGLPPLRTPSRSTVERAIRKLDPLLVYAGRYGEDAALRHAHTVGRGKTTMRPLQIVEMDECEMDLLTILALSGGDRIATEDELKAMGLDGAKKRIWVTVAIDRATRCILAMRISLAPSHCSALDGLRMIMEDKREWADKVGALRPWSMCGRPEEIVSDNGAGFVSSEFRTAAEDLGIRVTRTVAKVPQMRGVIESLFATIAQDLVARLTGRTFGSIVERGDHPSEKNAALTLDDLAFALVRWAVDIYHRRPHSGLAGETPAEAWERLTDEHHVLPPPGAREMRIAFGVQLERTLAKDGVRVMHVLYHDLALAQKYVRNMGAKVTVRVDPQDLGAVEILDNGVWRELPAVDQRFEGMSAADWARAVETRNRRRRETEQEVFEATWATYEAIRERNREARSLRGLVEDEWNQDRFDRTQERLTAFFATREREPDPEAPDPLVAGIPTGTGQPPARRSKRGESGIGRVRKED